MEIEALLIAVQELGRLTGKATPTIDVVAALLMRLAKERGLLVSG
jgi:2-dehydropantoate 2-reductase